MTRTASPSLTEKLRRAQLFQDYQKVFEQRRAAAAPASSGRGCRGTEGETGEQSVLSVDGEEQSGVRGLLCVAGAAGERSRNGAAVAALLCRTVRERGAGARG